MPLRIKRSLAGAGQPDHQRTRCDARRWTVIISAQNRQVSADELPGVPGDFVRLAVTDNGTGISSADLEMVMEPFFTTKDVGKGSGLGLSMVYGFAKQSNGAFRIDSELGQGTTAELWLPRAPMRTRPPKDKPKEPKRRPKIPKLSVLLVDDHAEVRATTAAVLEDFGPHGISGGQRERKALDVLIKLEM